jgi:hypothetical protein
MNKYEISPNFTLEDIRKIRDEEYERQKDMTPLERVYDSARRGREAMKRLGLEDHHIPSSKSKVG